MAFNFYDYEEHIYFDVKPAIYYGWHYSFTGDTTQSAQFSTKKRKEEYVAVVKEAIQPILSKKANGVELESDELELLAALGAFSNDEDHKDAVDTAVNWIYPRLPVEALDEAISLLAAVYRIMSSRDLRSVEEVLKEAREEA